MASGPKPALAPRGGMVTVVADTSVRVAIDVAGMAVPAGSIVIIEPADVAAVLDTPTQGISVGRGPVLRPRYDHLADLRQDRTGQFLRDVRDLERRVRL